MIRIIKKNLFPMIIIYFFIITYYFTQNVIYFMVLLFLVVNIFLKVLFAKSVIHFLTSK